MKVVVAGLEHRYSTVASYHDQKFPKCHCSHLLHDITVWKGQEGMSCSMYRNQLPYGLDRPTLWGGSFIYWPTGFLPSKRGHYAAVTLPKETLDGITTTLYNSMAHASTC